MPEKAKVGCLFAKLPKQTFHHSKNFYEFQIAIGLHYLILDYTPKSLNKLCIHAENREVK